MIYIFNAYQFNADMSNAELHQFEDVVSKPSQSYKYKACLCYRVKKKMNNIETKAKVKSKLMSEIKKNIPTKEMIHLLILHMDKKVSSFF